MIAKKSYILIVITFALWSSPGYSQKLQYGGLQQLSLTFGDNYTGTGFTLVNGVRFWKLFAGLGADAQFIRGYNYYNNNINPYNCSALFADVRYYINKNKNFFAKADGGINLINQRMGSSPNYNYKKLAGYYTAFGIGFKARLGKEVFYSFDVSYSLRQTRWINNYLNFRNEWQGDKYDIRQPALSINMGIEIF